MSELVWEWSIRIVTVLTLAVGVLGVAALMLFVGWVLIELTAKHFKLVGIIWEFVYFKFRRKNEAFILSELAQVRVELEKVRKERDALKYPPRQSKPKEVL